MWEFILNCVDRLSGYATGKLLPAVLIIVLGVLVIKLLMRIITSALKKTKIEAPVLSLIFTPRLLPLVSLAMHQ